MPEAERTLVTGALGCLGAWTLKALVDLGEEPVGFDLGSDDARLRLVLSEDERARITLVEGDVTDAARVGRALDEHGITNVVHLAALQVPFCRADPERGARVNVARDGRRSRGGQGAAQPDPRARVRELDGRLQRVRSLPRSRVGRNRAVDALRRVQARERGTARVYWDDDDVASIGIRPYVVYGPGRDQG